MRLALLVSIIAIAFTTQVLSKVEIKSLVANSTIGPVKNILPQKFTNDKLHVNWTHIDILVDNKKKATNSPQIQTKGNPNDKIPPAIDNAIKKTMENLKSLLNDKNKVKLINDTINDGIKIYRDLVQGNETKIIYDTKKFLNDSLKLLNEDDRVVDFVKQVKTVQKKFLADTLYETEDEKKVLLDNLYEKENENEKKSIPDSIDEGKLSQDSSD